MTPSIANSSNELERQQAIQRLTSTITLAKIRCLSIPDLLSRLRKFPHEVNETELFYSLRERTLSSEERGQVEELISYFAAAENSFSKKALERLDRRLVWLCELVSDSYARGFGLRCLSSSRRARRATGYRILTRVGVTAENASALIDIFRATADQTALELIARSSTAVTAVDPVAVLQSLTSRYWRARLLQCLLSSGPKTAYELAVRYPVEFAHAVGRSADQKHIPKLLELFESNCWVPEMAELTIWALSRIGAAEELDGVISAAIAHYGDAV